MSGNVIHIYIAYYVSQYSRIHIAILFIWMERLRLFIKYRVKHNNDDKIINNRNSNMWISLYFLLVNIRDWNEHKIVWF